MSEHLHLMRPDDEVDPDFGYVRPEDEGYVELWRCPLCGKAWTLWFGHAPRICPGCGQRPDRRELQE